MDRLAPGDNVSKVSIATGPTGGYGCQANAWFRGTAEIVIGSHQRTDGSAYLRERAVQFGS